MALRAACSEAKKIQDNRLRPVGPGVRSKPLLPRHSHSRGEGGSPPANEWRPQDTIWTGGSRLDGRELGSVCEKRSPGRWASRRFQLGSNKEVFDTDLRHLSGALHPRPATGERLKMHDFLRPHGRDRPNKDGHRWPQPALRYCDHGGVLSSLEQK